MKSCAGCWYYPENKPANHDNARCAFVGSWFYPDQGGECKAHRLRELGEPYTISYEVPPTRKGGFCSYICKLRVSTFDYDIGCEINAMMTNGKPGPGCPRYKGEDNG